MKVLCTMKYVFDEVHGYIPLDELERRLVDTPTFQRLRRIKQLAQAWLVYPGAVHTRFSHSLGVMHLMGKIAGKLADAGLIRKDDLRLLKIAALLHDVGHTPYSHAIESYFKVRYGLKHEVIGSWIITEDPYIKDVLREYGIEPFEVSAIIRGRHREASYNMLMSSDMDVDRLDYLLRDALHTGVKYGVIDIERIVQTITLDPEGYIAFPQKAVQAVEAFYIARLHMYRSVYYHKTIAGYQLLIQEIYRQMAETKEIRDFLKPFTDPEGIRKAISEGNLYLWDDFFIGGLMNLILGQKLGDEALRELIKLYLGRRGYRTVFEWVGFGKQSPLNSKLVKGLEEALSRDLRLKDERIAVKLYVESIPIITEGAEVRILKGGGSVRVNDYGGSIISSMPEEMGIVRLYSLPVTEGYTRELIAEFLKH
ncbi:MAG: HD domain-containing protein [Desulfurococcales archaeon]|nr:HD domain-containing protein [Desulfurococcales archaeon]